MQRTTLKRLLGIGALSLPLLLTACGESEKEQPFTSDFTGMYVGELPCADCFGILTHATFFDDHRVAITSLYYDSDETSETEWGRWSIEKDILKATMPYQNVNHYIQLSDDIIMMTDPKGKPSELLAEHYKLKKMTPISSEYFAGQYQQIETDELQTYQQTLTITPLALDQVNITINSTDPVRGCHFTGEGSLINNQIEVDLHQLKEEINSTLVIRPANEENNLYLSTSRFEEIPDLAVFCSEGASLMGDYLKKEENK